MFLFSRRYLKKFNTHHLTYVIGLPAIYLVLDLLMIIAAGYDLIDFLPTFALSSAPKIAAVAIAYFLYSHNNKRMTTAGFHPGKL